MKKFFIVFIIIFVVLNYNNKVYGAAEIKEDIKNTTNGNISESVKSNSDTLSDTLKIKKETNPITKDVLIAGGLSLIFPGGGQFYNKKYLKGVLIGGLEVSGIYLTYNLFKDDSVYKEDFAWYLAFFVIYSVFDAVVDAQFKHIEVKLNE